MSTGEEPPLIYDHREETVDLVVYAVVFEVDSDSYWDYIGKLWKLHDYMACPQASKIKLKVRWQVTNFLKVNWEHLIPGEKRINLTKAHKRADEFINACLFYLNTPAMTA